MSQSVPSRPVSSVKDRCRKERRGKIEISVLARGFGETVCHGMSWYEMARYIVSLVGWFWIGCGLSRLGLNERVHGFVYLYIMHARVSDHEEEIVHGCLWL